MNLLEFLFNNNDEDEKLKDTKNYIIKKPVNLKIIKTV